MLDINIMNETIKKLDEMIVMLTATVHRNLLATTDDGAVYLKSVAVASIASAIEDFVNARVILEGLSKPAAADPITLERQLEPNDGPPNFPPRR